VGWAFEQKFLRAREAMTKVNCFITMIDDVYDVYGSQENLSSLHMLLLGKEYLFLYIEHNSYTTVKGANTNSLRKGKRKKKKMKLENKIKFLTTTGVILSILTKLT